MSITMVTARKDLCLPTIGQLADDLVSAFSTSNTVRLDLSQVVAPDLSVVQLVAAARIEARERECDFGLSEPANATMHALLGRAGFLGDPSGDDNSFWFHGDVAQ